MFFLGHSCSSSRLSLTSLIVWRDRSAGGGGGEWAIPLRLQYNQMFNSQDRTRKGYLTGVVLFYIGQSGPTS